MTRIAYFLMGTLVVLALATPAHATINACAAAKKLCVAKKTAALLKCHSKNEKPPSGLDPLKFAACIQKAKDKFDGGSNPAKGCFAKLEAKFPGGCLSTTDTVPMEAKVDAYVDDVVCALDPAGGTCPTPTATPTPAATPTATSTPGCLGNGASCASSGQCCSLSCSAGTCVPSCSNGFQDGNETGIDCGGSCSPCGLGGGCASNLDCVATTQCSAGQCICAAGRSDCNNMPGDGCEVLVQSDANNCGGCGNVCNLPNANEVCNLGSCAVASCNSGFANCNGLNADGCEVSTLADLNNCGTCGHICNLANATPVCTSGSCAIGSCNTGFANCDGVPANGCEVNTQNSNANCGACNVVCVNPMTCVNSACQ